MNKGLFRLSMALCVLLFASLACETSASVTSVGAASLRSAGPEGPRTSVYAPDEPFYYVVDVINAQGTTRLKAVWYWFDQEGAANQLHQKEVVGIQSPLNFSISNSTPWPVGRYKVELYLDDTLARSEEFSVR